MAAVHHVPMGRAQPLPHRNVPTPATSPRVREQRQYAMTVTSNCISAFDDLRREARLALSSQNGMRTCCP